MKSQSEDRIFCGRFLYVSNNSINTLKFKVYVVKLCVSGKVRYQKYVGLLKSVKKQVERHDCI